eukprot:6209195-Pleurochrysis_carterae.AAC.3
MAAIPVSAPIDPVPTPASRRSAAAACAFEFVPHATAPSSADRPFAPPAGCSPVSRDSTPTSPSTIPSAACSCASARPCACIRACSGASFGDCLGTCVCAFVCMLVGASAGDGGDSGGCCRCCRVVPWARTCCVALACRWRAAAIVSADVGNGSSRDGESERCAAGV